MFECSIFFPMKRERSVDMHENAFCVDTLIQIYRGAAQINPGIMGSNGSEQSIDDSGSYETTTYSDSYGGGDGYNEVNVKTPRQHQQYNYNDPNRAGKW